jgi:hypothetical protein
MPEQNNDFTQHQLVNQGFVDALIAAQKKFKPAVRNQENEFYGSSYVDLEGAWDCVRDALHEHGFTVIQTVNVDKEFGPMLVTELVHRDGGHRLSLYPLAPAKPNDPQALGGATTYARRYALMAMLMLCPEDDDGNAASAKAAAPATGYKAKPKQKEMTIPGQPSAPVYVKDVTSETRPGWRGSRTTVTFSDGAELSTFDPGVAGMAHTCKSANAQVEYTTEQKGKYVNLAGIRAVSGQIIEVEAPSDLPF